jgi:hypothetical protein
MSRRTQTLSAFVPVFALLALAATPALAKMDAEAKLDTPIARGSAPGSTIDVGWSVFSEFDGSQYPLYGSPVFIRLVSPDRRQVTEVFGTEAPSGSGHYTASIQVPPGGIGEVVVGLFGESCVAGEGCQRSDLIFPLTDDPLVTGVAPVASPAPVASIPVTPAETSPAGSAPIGLELAPIVLIGIGLAIAGATAAVIVGRRRTLGADVASR